MPLSRRRWVRAGSVVGAASAALLAAILVPAAAFAGAPGVAVSGVPDSVPVAGTPNFCDGAVNAIAEVGSRVFLGGTFTTIGSGADCTAAGTTTTTRNYLLAVNKSTGALDPTFLPVMNGEVTSIQGAADGKSIYVGGKFSARVARLDSTTGTPVAGFTSPGSHGITAVNDLALANGHLLLSGWFAAVGGANRSGLASLNPSTGAVDSYLTIGLKGHHNAGRVSGAVSSSVGGYKFGVSPDGKQLVVGGNFTSVVSGSTTYDRDQVVKITMTSTGTSVDTGWRTLRYTAPCAYTYYDFYLRAIQFSPDGSYFVVTTTGGTNNGGTETCDAVARYSSTDSGTDVQPQWVDYTGRDSLYSTAVTTTAVYVGGHQRWLNNPNGQDKAAQGAVPRPGLAALDPRTGLPLAWNPGRNPRGHGAEALLATPEGLWVGSDTAYIGDYRYRRDMIAFFPFNGAGTASETTGSLPGNVYRAGQVATPASQVLYRVNAGGPAVLATDGGPAWAADTAAAPSALHNTGGTAASYSPTLTTFAPAVPTYVPAAIFNDERWDASTSPEMTWTFPVPAGHPVRINLLFSNRCSCTSTAGKRTFNVLVDGTTKLSKYDIVASAGDQTGAIQTIDVTPAASTLTVTFTHAVQNPLLDGIELLDLSKTAPAPDGMTARAFTGSTVTSDTAVDAGGVAWGSSHTVFEAGHRLFYSRGTMLYSRTVTADSTGALSYGAEAAVDPYDDPAWSDVQTGSGQTYRGVVPSFYGQLPNLTGAFYANGYLYYTQANDIRLLRRTFSVDSGVVGPTETVVATSRFWGDVRGLFVSGSTGYFGSRSTGTLQSVTFSYGVPSANATTVSGAGTGWAARGLFLVG